MDFELRIPKGISVPIWISIGFQQGDRRGSQILNNDTFCRPPLTSAECNIGTQKYPDSAILLICNDDDYSQIFGQIKEASRAPAKDGIHEP